MSRSSRWVIVALSTTLAMVALAGCTNAAPASAAAQRGCLDVANSGLTLIAIGDECAEGLVPVVWTTADTAVSTPAAGADGTDGTDGLDGSNGTDGAAGSAGPSGAIGAKGATGAAGQPGAIGPAGPQGLQGIGAWSTLSAWSSTIAYTAGPPSSVVTHNGSSYLAAASNIGETPGSGTSWILIAQVGAKGDQGDPGPQGEAGADGQDGADGAVGLNGQQGEAGLRGAPGVPGPESNLDQYFGQRTAPAGFYQQAIPGCFVGDMFLTASGYYRAGMPASGQNLLITDYQNLFDYIGQRYGGVDNQHFNLPDMRAITPNGMTWTICTTGAAPPTGTIPYP